MARPKTDMEAMRTRMLEEAERLLKAHGPSRLTVSDVAAASGMSQSNAYRFFASKRDLLDALGERWFAGIEAETARIIASDEPPLQQAIRLMVRQYEIKRGRYLEDPELFRAYLGLGHADMAVVEDHLARLRAQLEAVMARCAAQSLLGTWDAAGATALLDATTVRFRDPAQIMRHLDEDSPQRVAEAVAVILAGLRRSVR